MKKKIIASVSALAMCLSMAGAVPAGALPVCAVDSAAAETAVTDIESILPKTYDEFRKHIELFGNVSTCGKYLIFCQDTEYSNLNAYMLDRSGTGEFKEVKKYLIPADNGGDDHLVIAYEAVKEGEGLFRCNRHFTVNGEPHAMTFFSSYCEIDSDLNVKITRGEGAVAETAIDGILPATEDDFSAFCAENGYLSTHGRYLVYCTELDTSKNEKCVIEHDGEGGIAAIKSYTIRTGSETVKRVYVYEAIVTGAVEFTVYRTSGTGDTNEGNGSMTRFFVDEELNITEQEDDGFVTVPGVELPKNSAEFEAYKLEHGTASAYGNYLVLCLDVAIAHGEKLVVEQTGRGSVTEVGRYDLPIESDTPQPVAGLRHQVVVFRTVSRGYVELKFWGDAPTYSEPREIFWMGCTIGKDMTIHEGEELDPVMGDANGDGKFGVADMVTFHKWLLGGGTELAEWELLDINGDGKVDSFDMCLMRKMLVEAQNDILGYKRVCVIDSETGEEERWFNVKLGMNIRIQNAEGNWIETTEIFDLDMQRPNSAVIDYSKYVSAIKAGRCTISIYVTSITSHDGDKYIITPSEYTSGDTLYIPVKWANQQKLTGEYTINVINNATGKPLKEGTMHLGTDITVKTDNGWAATGPVFTYELSKGNPVKHSYKDYVTGVMNGTATYSIIISGISSNNKSKGYAIDRSKTVWKGETVTVYVDEVDYQNIEPSVMMIYSQKFKSNEGEKDGTALRVLDKNSILFSDYDSERAFDSMTLDEWAEAAPKLTAFKTPTKDHDLSEAIAEIMKKAPYLEKERWEQWCYATNDDDSEVIAIVYEDKNGAKKVLPICRIGNNSAWLQDETVQEFVMMLYNGGYLYGNSKKTIELNLG